MEVVMMMTGLYLVAEVLRSSALVTVISSPTVLVLIADISFVFVITVLPSGSVVLTLKGLLGTLTPPQVTASVCLTAEVGVYEQEYTLSPLLFTFTSMGTPSASWENRVKCNTGESLTQVGLCCTFLLGDDRSNLCDDSQWAVSGIFGLDGEFSRFVYDTATLLQSRSISPDLQTSTFVKNKHFLGGRTC